MRIKVTFQWADDEKEYEKEFESTDDDGVFGSADEDAINYIEKLVSYHDSKEAVKQFEDNEN